MKNHIYLYERFSSIFLKLLYYVVSEYPIKSFIFFVIIIYWTNGHCDIYYNFNFFELLLADPISMSLNPQQIYIYKNEDLAEHLELAKAIVLARRADLGISNTCVRLADAGIKLRNVEGPHRYMCLALKRVLDANAYPGVIPFSHIAITDHLIMVVIGSSV